MRQRGISLAEVSLAIGVSAAVAATAATAGTYLMGKSKMAKLEEHALKLMAAVDANIAAGGEPGLPWPRTGVGNGALLNTQLKPYMNEQTNPAQYWNPVQNATQEVVAMYAAGAGSYCTDFTVTLNSSGNIVNTAYYGTVIYCYFNDLLTDDRRFYINNRGNTLMFQKYALATVDQYGWMTQVIGR